MNNYEEKLNFLKEELKKIEDDIKVLKHKLANIGTQERLWALREKLLGEIREINFAQEQSE